MVYLRPGQPASAAAVEPVPHGRRYRRRWGRAVAALITGRHRRQPPTESTVVPMNLRELARTPRRTLDAGSYRGPQGETVDLASGMRAAIAGTRLYEPTQPLPALATPGTAPTGSAAAVQVTGESTLAASRRLAHDGDVAALV